LGNVDPRTYGNASIAERRDPDAPLNKSRWPFLDEVSRGNPLAPLRLATPCDEPPSQLQHVAAVLWYSYILKAFGELRER
jgi:hypothetical protein